MTNDEISAYSLKTVTYGIVSSPFLANRVTKQLAIDEGEKYPLGASIISSETYMDDTLSGICKFASISLHKWIADDKIF